ncbi:MAG: hypothetical protein EU530_11690 [Promethearchaeota archaeon]|nr:MAG: hypothetical protein EU530_11690 [Candidatus Lokiarchaeota archaeon]
MKRIISFDFFRGLAVMLMLFMHVFIHIYSVANPSNFGDVLSNPGQLAIFVPVFLFSNFRGFFLIISMILNAYNVTRSLRKGVSREKVLGKQLFTGFIIYIVGLLSEGYFQYHGVFGRSLLTRTWRIDRFSHILHTEAINSIGISIMILGILFYFLSFNDGANKPLRNAIILAIIGIAVVVLSPLMYNVASKAIGSYIDLGGGELGYSYYHVQYDFNSFGEFFNRLGWAILVGKEQPLFPFLGVVCIGAILGNYLAQEKPKRLITGVGMISGGVIFIIGVVLLLFESDIMDAIVEIADTVHPTFFFCMLTGLQLLIICGWLRAYEFNPKRDMVKYTKRTRFFRRWGLVSLTLYVLQYYIEYLCEWIGEITTGIPFLTRWGVDFFPYVLIMMVLVVAVWDLVFRIWEKLKFVGTFEWQLTSLSSVVLNPQGEKGKKAERMNIRQTLYEPEPVVFYSE